MISYAITAAEVETLADCPLCESARLRELSRVFQRSGVEFLATAMCGGCGFVFRHRRPTKAWFSKAFAERERLQSQQSINALNPKIEDERFQRYRLLGQVLRAHFGGGPRGVSVLDVGCGPGTGLKAFEELDFVATGIDEDNTRARHGLALGLKIEVAPWESYAPAERFDVITCLHSIEHFHSPRDLLERAHAWLRPGGLLVLEVPNLAHFVTDWTDALYLAHMANYSPATLERLGALAGFHVVARVCYYATDVKNHENLCLFFSADRAVAAEPGASSDGDEPTWESVVRAYGAGLEHVAAPPYEFEVPLINDISLGYKNSTRISANLRENLQMREASFDSQSRRYFVE